MVRVSRYYFSTSSSWLLLSHFRKALTFFRGEQYELLQEEFDDIGNALAQKGPSQKKISGLSRMELLSYLRPFSAAVTIVLFRLSGFSVMSHYTATYLEKAGVNFDPLLGSILIGAMRWFASLTTIVVLNFMAKRASFLIFGWISVLSMTSGRMS